MHKSKKKKIIVLIVIVMIMLTICIFYYPLRSYLVMHFYSKYNEKSSVMQQMGFEVDIPGGNSTPKKDWYPFVNIFDASSRFSNYTNQDLTLSVLYNFGAFSGKSSSIYDDTSPYFSAFYGAYVVKNNEIPNTPYGFQNGTIVFDEIMKVALYDYKYIVIGDLGCINPVFEVLSYDISDSVNYAGYDGWVKINADIKTNSVSHNFKSKKAGYIQYGKPQNNDKPDFYEITLKGRMYARYFEQFDSTIVIYVMGEDSNMIEICDTDILSFTKIKKQVGEAR